MEELIKNFVLFTNSLPGGKIGLKLCIFYASYLAFPFFIWCLYSFHNSPKLKTVLLVLVVIFIHARFIEPQIIIFKQEKVQTGFKSNFVLISDPHLGIFKGKKFLERVVDKINTQKTDVVLIAGDFTYWADKNTLESTFAAFKKLQVPAYFVLGNHDVEKPGEKIRDVLIPALENMGMQYIDNKVIQTKNFTLVGLGDRWAGEDDVQILDSLPSLKNTIVLVHNPDTTLDYGNRYIPLSLAGHTHGGQIRIPLLYKLAIPTQGNFDKGLYDNSSGKVFVSSGLGEVALSMRLLNPPEIVHIHTY